ncbi:MAG TPA: N-acetyltransferase, partial [Caldisericia bacterium]|nr:N-acetyltransferase [Caldisericia bacterium]
MRKNPPEKVSEEKIIFDVSEIEPVLSGPSLHLKPWDPVSIRLSTGETMLIREAKLEEAPTLLNYLKKFLDLDYDFYDIVGARVYSEVLGWYRSRLKDPYNLLGIIDGKVVGFANGRLLNKDINISLHTMAFRRGGRIGAVMYYAKTHYAFEILENKEFWATYESYNGWKRWGIGMA